MPDPGSNSRSSFDTTWMLTRLATASWETILHRSVLIATGTCSVAEYSRMVAEKMDASRSATVALMTGQGGTAVIAPYLDAATANAKRLRSPSGFEAYG